MNSKSQSSLKLSQGEIVSHNEAAYKIIEIISFDTAYCENIQTKRKETLNINDLTSINNPSDVSIDIESISDADWEIINNRYTAIKPLLEMQYGRKDVNARAKEVGVSHVTLYRWLDLYLNTGTMDGLLPEKRGVKKGTIRILGAADQIIKDVIKTVYLTPQRSSVEKVINEVRRRCIEKGIDQIPHANTIRNRVKQISDYERISKRRGKKRADALYKPTPGKLEADFPLDIVQIDHTPVDIILVDEKHRKPIGRPWLTLAIDIYSRMVVGYHLSLDAPSATSIAMCVSQAIFPKDQLLGELKIKGDWPVWGTMERVHVDNGADFRSKTFRKACMLHSINLEYRPVGQPQFGGHIERLLGTIMNEVHDLPGTTFSSVHDRDNYDSEKHAVMTLFELEQWLVNLFCNVYHKKIHDGIKMPPEKKWEIGIFGDGETEGCGVKNIPKDKKRTILNFLPMHKRTIQRYGVSIDGIYYYADTLRQLINAKDPDNPKLKRKFIIRRDPRNISCVWLFNEDANQYLEIPYADQSHPPISLWELRQASKKANQEGAKSVNEKEIFKNVTEMRQLVDESTQKTKKARRLSQNRKQHKQSNTPKTLKVNTTNTNDKPNNSHSLLDDIGQASYGEID